MNFLRFSGCVDRRHVLGRDRGAADDEQVDARGDDGLVELLRALRREGSGDRHSRRADLGEALAHELGLDRLGVQLLHPPGRRGLLERGDLGEQRLGVVVPGPDALEVEHAEPAELAEHDRRPRAHDRVHRRPQHRDGELEGVDRPRGRHVLRDCACAARARPRCRRTCRRDARAWRGRSRSPCSRVQPTRQARAATARAGCRGHVLAAARAARTAARR